MANPEHLEILAQGVEVWTDWREGNREIVPDLSGADLNHEDFSEADFSGVDLSGAKLIGTEFGESDLSGADLSGADLTCANLYSANLTAAILANANLGSATLSDTNLTGADITDADLSVAHLDRAKLRGADLSRTYISGTDFNGADLAGADFTEVDLEGASFGDLDLSQVKGLETVDHGSPSTIGLDTINKSRGDIPEVFLRGCGLSDWQIETVKLYQPDLSLGEITSILYRIHDLRAHQAIQINPLFISYSHTDNLFVDEMENYLNEKGVRFWRDVHHATAGRLERQVDRAIRLNPTVLLVLSEHSVQSDWVQHEVRLARKLEVETKRDVLCPVALDDRWKTCRWPERLREQVMEYNILDFSGWRDGDIFRRMFTRLLDGLDLFYK